MTLEMAGSTKVSNVTGLVAGPKTSLYDALCLMPFHHAFSLGREASSTFACFACSTRKTVHVSITSAALYVSPARKDVLLSWPSAASNKAASCFWVSAVAAASCTATPEARAKD